VQLPDPPEIDIVVKSLVSLEVPQLESHNADGWNIRANHHKITLLTVDSITHRAVHDHCPEQEGVGFIPNPGQNLHAHGSV
jgi:hypothetical protein